MSDSDSDSGPEDREPPSKVPKIGEAKSNQKKKGAAESSTSEEKGVFKITSKRFASVSEFKGKLRVDLREFYEDKETEELKPGRKGISLSLEEWNKLLSISVDINKYIDKMK